MMNFVQACVECKKNGGKYANDAGEVKKVTDWTKVKVDTPILTANINGGFNKRHFKSFESGWVSFYPVGTTSWSVGESGCVGMLRTDKCKLAEIEDVNDGE